MIETILKEKGIKVTKSRIQILDLICNNYGIGIKDLINKCNEKMNQTTIYRKIDTFLEKEIIEKKISYNNEVYYTLKPMEHSHYICCIKCHKKEKINEKEIENFEKNVSKNYKIVSHDIEFFGICKNCS